MKEFFKTDEFFAVQLIGSKWMIERKNHAFLSEFYSHQPEECKLHSFEEFVSLTLDAHTFTVEDKNKDCSLITGNWTEKKVEEFFSLDQESSTFGPMAEVLEFYDVEATEEGLAGIISFMMMHLLASFGEDLPLLSEMGLEEIADLFNDLVLITE